MDEEGNGKSFDIAAAEAENELRIEYEKLSKEMKEGVRWVAKWWIKHYGKAGHRRLGRAFVRIFK